MRAVLAWLLCAAAVAADGAMPAQFAAWGSRGPELPPPPAGWTEAVDDAQVAATDADRARGFVLVRRSPFDALAVDAVPAADEVGGELDVVAARGQYEPATLALCALADLDAVGATVGDLAGERTTIRASQVDLRWVRPVRTAVGDHRFRLTPFWLERRDAVRVAMDRIAQAWLTIHVPDDAPPGIYRGRVVITVAGAERASVPLTLRVLPFTLPPPPIETAMSFFSPAPDEARRRQQLIDQREHGLTSVESAVAAEVVSRDQHWGDDDRDATVADCRRALALRRAVFGADARPLTAEVGHQILYEWKNDAGWFAFWPRTPEREGDLARAITTVRDELKAAGHPMRLFLMDEPGGHPDTIAPTAQWLRVARAAFPDLATTETIGGGIALGVDEIGLLGDVDLLVLNRFSRRLCARLLARGKPYGVYNGGGATEQVASATRDRHFFGLYAARTGASDVLQWAYACGEPWGAIRGNDGYSALADDGPVPSIALEAVRAGIDDHRALDLLESCVAAARAAGERQAAEAGDAVVREVLGRVGFDWQPIVGAGAPAPRARDLELRRWRIEQAIVELLARVPLERALATRPSPPAMLDLPETAPPAPRAIGPPLIARGGFEDGLEPWALSGPAQAPESGIVADAHGGVHALRLAAKPTATGMDVLTCVWGWGREHPTMTLHVGKTYEFSAWLKVASGEPRLKLELPAGSVALTRGGDYAEIGGWRRDWLRVTMAADAEPRYLAVWMQGPGDALVDDLALTEVAMPALTLDAPEAVDGGDAAIVVRVARAADAGASAIVRVRIDDGAPRELTLAGAASGEVRCTGPLTLGPHRVHATVGDDAATAAEATIVRLRGPFDR